MADNARWFVVHTYSGYEQKVADNILTIVKNRQMQSQISDVMIPMQTVKEVKNGEEKEIKRKIFPGYVMVKVACIYKKRGDFEEELAMTDDAWYVIRNTRGVTGFVGPDSKPVPLSDAEVIALGIEEEKIELGFKEGDLVTITFGSLAGSSGIVNKIDLKNKKVEVLISMFGRETPTEVELADVEAVSE